MCVCIDGALCVGVGGGGVVALVVGLSCGGMDVVQHVVSMSSRC
jgi:hypothetical protein